MKKILLPVCFLAVFLLGWQLGRPDEKNQAEALQAEADTEWTCSMHPQVRRSSQGLCPICEMDLIPLTADSSSGLRELTVTAEAAALLDLRVSPVVQRPAAVHVDLFGKIAYDERKVNTTTARISGHLDRFYVDYTGTLVRKGDHIAEIYSPDLLVAQQDLIKAAQGLEQARQAGTRAAINTQTRLLKTARERLRLLQLTDAQINDIAQQTEPTDHITLFSPQDGVVIKRHIVEGAYVREGDPLFSVAGLDSVWLNLEAYESDLPWLKFAQDVAFHVEALPGQTFHGRVAFINPEIDSMRRVVKVRVNVPNERRLLKPGMFVRATIDSAVTRDGSVIDPELAGKWISPMHPEIVQDGPGQCSICGMDLVPAEELGFLQAAGHQAHEDPLLVPTSAVLQTGRRAVVYVRLEGAPNPKFEGREILLGPRVGDHYMVEAGLAAGEWVVTRGAFKLDSELQIKARPSMMNRDAGIEEIPANEAETSLRGFWEPVPRLLGTLGQSAEASQWDRARQALADLETVIKGIPTESFHPSTMRHWKEFSNRLRLALADAKTQPDQNLAVTVRTVQGAFEETGRYMGLPNRANHATNPVLASDETVNQIKESLQSYWIFTKALADDDEAAALEARGALIQRLDPLTIATTELAQAPDIAALRQALKPLSMSLIERIQTDGPDRVGNAYVIHCPMAFDYEGADWLAAGPAILNPYFGAEMLRCGEVKAHVSFEARSSRPSLTEDPSTQQSASPDEGHNHH